jgi:hypothetical protein
LKADVVMALGNDRHADEAAIHDIASYDLSEPKAVIELTFGSRIFYRIYC